MEVPKFIENALICVITVKVSLLTLSQVITVLAYVSTHLLFSTYLLISNRIKNTIVTPNILRRKIKPIALII